MPRQPAIRHNDGPDDSKPLSRRVLVNIHRDKDMQVVPRVVWAHEVPILEAIHVNVRQVEDISTLDEGYTAKPRREMFPWVANASAPPRPSQALCLGWVFVGDAEAEYERLVMCYGMHPEIKQSWVENVYGRFSGGTFERVLGRPTLEDLPEAQLRSLILETSFYTLPTATFKATEEERKAAEAKHHEFATMTRGDLIKLARDAGVNLEG